MTENLTQRFVRLRKGRLASNALSELGLDHAKDTLAVAALVVILHVLVFVHTVVVEHLIPHFALGIPASVIFESDVRRAALLFDKTQIAIT